jgi:hypothetical protein
LLTEIGFDNGMAMYRPDKWMWPIDIDLNQLEQDALRLPANMVAQFACGEHEMNMRLVKEYQLQALHDFLEESFQGVYSSCFYNV